MLEKELESVEAALDALASQMLVPLELEVPWDTNLMIVLRGLTAAVRELSRATKGPSVDEIHESLVRKARRRGPLGLS